MHMVTMPVVYKTADPNRVLLEKSKADQVWTALKNDRPIPESATRGTATGKAKGVVNTAE
ncbi:LCP family protein required for cell wall assembly OS=Streptomyces griseomycini OX=66895 GN=FHS37_000982 PE=3 SV=1 [Streptomyces griseomycini]